MYTKYIIILIYKYNYIYMSMIEILYSYMSVYTNLPKYNPLPEL